jgi:hypothetical protein
VAWERIVQKGREARIIIDATVTACCPLIELQALAGKAVALLACRRASVSATILRTPRGAEHSGVPRGTPAGGGYAIILTDGRHRIVSRHELKPSAPCVDFEITTVG